MVVLCEGEEPLLAAAGVMHHSGEMNVLRAAQIPFLKTRSWFGFAVMK